ncbi:hypothetical protein [Flavobacterium sp. TAB 87]|uniref:hypothetical protein n=1 Tax=Flavobacterium sp. TAB 87 TaxID=1729581 RepID=UPI00076DD517|nr:hypothetical protein [Flavobacterium sp. TAB 87]KVV16121.1 hypothetical protein AP058_00286 [Flavobacterium sp. TAB 87]
MKKALLFLSLFIMLSCSKESKVKEVAAFEFNNTWYWVIQYENGASKQDVEHYVSKWANPNQTSHFFIYDKSIDLSVFKDKAFNFNTFAQTVLANKPQYGYYKMPPDTKLNNDAIWLLEQSQKQN